jgi:O-antigen/teichoic acid export membrane protein
MRNYEEQLVVGGIWFLTLMIVSGLFSWLWSVVVSRAYGPQGYGIFNTALSLYNFLWVIVLGGISHSFIKHGSEYVAKSGWRISGYFSSTLKYLTLIGLCVFMLLFMAASKVYDQIMKFILLSIAISFLFSGIKDALFSIIGSLQKSEYLSVIKATNFLGIFTIGLVFVLLNLPAIWLPFLVAVGTISQLLVSTYFIKFKKLPFKLGALFKKEKIKFESLRTYLSIFIFGFFISLSMISFNVMKSLDIIALKMFFDYEKIGIYSVADIVSSILFYMTSFSLPVIPAVAEACARKDRELLKNYVEIAVKYPLLIGLPLTITILTLAKPLIVWIYGDLFADAILPLQILIIGTFMLMFSYNLSSILIGIGKSKVSGISMAISAVYYIVLIFILTPLFGFIGAALSLTFTGVLLLFLISRSLRKELNLSLYGEVYKVLIPAFIMFLILFGSLRFSPLFMIMGIIGSILAFVTFSYITGYITRRDVEMIKLCVKSFRNFT